jgi:hypothetical protein
MGVSIETPMNANLISIVAIIRPIAGPLVIRIARCRAFVCVLVRIAKITAVSAVLTAALKTIVMSAFVRLRSMIVLLFVATIPSIFIVMGERRDNWNTEKQNS